jgi:hypothetical protein
MKDLNALRIQTIGFIRNLYSLNHGRINDKIEIFIFIIYIKMIKMNRILK